mmetsp:Transcript_25935/g.49184  ORF Transcript_25935/g.49184 Transcript_25935/m.49184 type:complete len:426 (-) Transcript_25935:186-1463(-)
MRINVLQKKRLITESTAGRLNDFFTVGVSHSDNLFFGKGGRPHREDAYLGSLGLDQERLDGSFLLVYSVRVQSIGRVAQMLNSIVFGSFIFRDKHHGIILQDQGRTLTTRQVRREGQNLDNWTAETDKRRTRFYARDTVQTLPVDPLWLVTVGHDEHVSRMRTTTNSMQRRKGVGVPANNFVPFGVGEINFVPQRRPGFGNGFHTVQAIDLARKHNGHLDKAKELITTVSNRLTGEQVDHILDLGLDTGGKCQELFSFGLIDVVDGATGIHENGCIHRTQTFFNRPFDGSLSTRYFHHYTCSALGCDKERRRVCGTRYHFNHIDRIHFGQSIVRCERSNKAVRLGIRHCCLVLGAALLDFSRSISFGKTRTAAIRRRASESLVKCWISTSHGQFCSTFLRIPKHGITIRYNLVPQQRSRGRVPHV